MAMQGCQLGQLQSGSTIPFGLNAAGVWCWVSLKSGVNELAYNPVFQQVQSDGS
jgi:hypothetical protein